jgi:hypothetical protein
MKVQAFGHLLHWLLIGCVFAGVGSAQTTTDVPSFDLPDGFFPILTWDLPHWSEAPFSDPDHGLVSLHRCGFTTAAFVRPQHLAEVEKLGMQCLLARQHFPVDWRKLSDEQIEAVVKSMVDEAKGSKSVMGFFLADEPGLPDFPSLGKAVAAVRKLAPGKLAYINLFPDYATLGAPDLSQLGTANYTEYLEQFVAQVKPQFISYDNYRIQYSHDQKNPAISASYYSNLLEVRRVALKHNLPFWNIVSSNRIRPDMPIPSPANLLLQAYTTLAAGGKGLTWYTYYATGYLYAPIDKEGHQTTTWSYLKMVNDQVKVLGPLMMPLKSTGVYFTRAASVAAAPATLPALPGELLKEASSSAPLMVGELTGAGGGRYAMVVNLSLSDSAQVKISARDERATVVQISPVDGKPLALEAGNAFWLAAGQGALLKFSTSPAGK